MATDAACIRRISLALALTLLPGVLPAAAEELEFGGTSPCGALPRQFIGIPAASDCDRITWRLTLSTNERTFMLAAIHGISAQNAPGFVDGGTEVQLQGKWSLLKGTSTDPAATVYGLVTHGAERTLHFAVVSDNLLHPLDERKALMRGDASWSYTLSRLKPVPQTSRPAARSIRRVSTEAPPRGAAEPTRTGVFEGRTPCQPIARQLGVGKSPACTKMKWRLTLFKDSATGTSGTYKLESSFSRNPPRTGQWKTYPAPQKPGAAIYQLDPDERGGFLSLFAADDDILFVLDDEGGFLVGNIDFSYTLNRTN